MRYADATEFRQAIEQRIKTDADGGDVMIVRRRKRIAFDRMLARLVAVAPSKWVLKGGFALDVRISDQARATRDVDIAWHHHESELFDTLLDVAGHDAGDFFEFAIERTDELAVLDTQAHRFKITASLAGREFEVFPLDVGIRSTGPTDVEVLYVGDELQFAGIDRFEIPVLPLELHVAEKVHAYTPDYGDGRANTRVKDLVDLALIATHFKVNSVAATTIPQCAARRIATNYAFTIGYWSVEDENFAISLRSSSSRSAFGRTPPTDEPCSNISVSWGSSGSSCSSRWAASASSSSVARLASRGR